MGIVLHVVRPRVPPLDETELARHEAKLSFEQFCFLQKDRLRASLRRSEARIAQARYGENATTIISTKGWTATTSRPVQRQYLDQDERDAIRKLL